MTFAITPRGRYLPVRTRLLTGLALSLLFHAALLSLRFGIPGIGLPSLELPWNERRAHAPELSVRLAPAQPTPVVTASIAESEPRPQPPAAKPVSAPKRPPLPNRPRTETALQMVKPAQVAKPAPAPEKQSIDIGAAPVEVRRAPTPVKSHPNIIAHATPKPESFAVPPPVQDETSELSALKDGTPEQPTDAEAAKPSDEIAAQAKEQALAAQKQAEQERARRTLEIEAKRLEEANAKRQAAELAAQKQAEEDELRKAEALALRKLAAQKQENEEAARHALELEAKRQEEAKVQEEAKARRQAMELEARRQAEEAVRQKQAEAVAQQRELDRIAAGTREANKPADNARLPRDLFGGGDLAGRALEQARKFDTQRNEVPPAAAADNARRRSVFGSAGRDVGLALYIESWRLKIERNGNLNYAQSSRDKARYDPVVTVAIRSDGSIEDIAIHLSSGRADLDEAVRRIARLNARYGAFPPELARRFDVIEIRRVWSFDDKLKLLEEVP